MRILQLCKKFPYPLKDGEAIAVTYLSKALADLGCEITLLSMNTTKHFSDLSQLPTEYNHYKEIHDIDLDNSIKVVDAIKNLFSKESYHVSRYVDVAYKQKLIELLRAEEYDIIQLETLYLAPYVPIIKEFSKGLVTMRAHNVEFEIWERITKNTEFLPKKLYLNYLTGKLKNFELEHLNTYDYLLPVTERDLKTFKNLGYKNGALALPIGLETNNYVKQGVSIKNGEGLNICFIGALDWMPNYEGFDWFLKNVWNRISQKHDDVYFSVAGRNTPDSIKSIKEKNVVVHGEVADAVSFINDADIMVVPLFSGSGMRVKILEGMALGKTVITTSLGLEGISAKHKKELLIADSPEEFVEMINYCKADRSVLEEIGNNARDFVIKYYDNKKNAQQLLELYSQLIISPKYAR